MKTVREKLEKEMPEFVSEVDSASTEDLEHRLSALWSGLFEVDKAIEKDDKLQEVKTLAKDLGQPYRDAKKAIKQKANFIVEILNSRGIT